VGSALATIRQSWLSAETKVYGRRKPGAGRSRQGHLAYNSYVVPWAARGRALTSELQPGDQARIKAAESLRLLRRAKRLLTSEYGQITGRFGGVPQLVGI
jgi:hypothetical protein